MKKLLLIFLVLSWAFPALAQDDSQTLISQSGRLTISYPAGWVGSNEVQTDVQRIFASEALSIAENQETLDKVAIGPDIGGSHLVVAMFPTLDIYPLNPNPQNFTEVTDLLFGQGNLAVTELEVSGYPAARIEQDNGILFMVVGMGPNIIAISAQATNAEAKTILLGVMDSLQISIPQDRFETENLIQTLTTSDQRVSFKAGAGWYTGERGGIFYAAPLPSPIQDIGFNLVELGPMESLFWGIFPRPYADFARLFPPDWQPTPTDLEIVLDLSLSEIGIFSEADFAPINLGDFTGTTVSLLIGENQGRAWAFDGGQTIYIFVSLFPSARQSELQALADAIFESISIAPLDPALANLPPEGFAVGYRAPNFQSSDLEGNPIQLADLQGQVVMLNFWFTTCPPCREEMPAMQSVYDAYTEQGFTILAVNRADPPAEIRRFMTEIGVGFPVALDSTARIQLQYHIFGYPTSFFLDRNGVIYHIQYEPLTAEKMTELVELGLALP